MGQLNLISSLSLFLTLWVYLLAFPIFHYVYMSHMIWICKVNNYRENVCYTTPSVYYISIDKSTSSWKVSLKYVEPVMICMTINPKSFVLCIQDEKLLLALLSMRD